MKSFVEMLAVLFRVKVTSWDIGPTPTLVPPASTPRVDVAVSREALALEGGIVLEGSVRATLVS